MKEEDEDPFGSLTRFSLIPTSQSIRLRSSVPFARQHEHFPNDTESQPDTDKVFDKMPARITVKKRVLNVLSGSEDYSVGTQTEGLSKDQAFDEMPVKKIRVLNVLDRSEGFSIGTQIEGLGGDKVFDEIRMRNPVKIESFGEKTRVLTGSEGFKRVLDDLGGDKVFGEMPMRKAVKIESLEKKTRVLTGSEGSKRVLGGDEIGLRNREVKLGIEVIDLEEDCELGVRKGNPKMGPNEDTSSNRVLDLDENDTCDDLPMRNAEAVVGKKLSANVDKGGDLTTRNFVGKGVLNDGEAVCRDEIRGFLEKGTGGIDNVRRVSWKDCQNYNDNSERRELYGNLFPSEKGIVKAGNKAGEPCRNENRRSSEKGIGEIDRREENNVVASIGGSRKACGDEPCRDVIRGCSSKETDTSKVNNDHREGKIQARKLPSSLHTPAKTSIRKIFASHCERNKKAVEKNSSANETSEPVGQKSKDSLHGLLSSVGKETTNDQIMKNLLDGLDLIIGKEKEKVDDGSNEEVDILETAMKMGLVFPRPRWWPEEGFGDE